MDWPTAVAVVGTVWAFAWMVRCIAASDEKLARHEPVCEECGRPCDQDGYCDPCAEAAVADELKRDPHAYDHIGLRRKEAAPKEKA